MNNGEVNAMAEAVRELRMRIGVRVATGALNLTAEKRLPFRLAFDQLIIAEALLRDAARTVPL